MTYYSVYIKSADLGWVIVSTVADKDRMYEEIASYLAKGLAVKIVPNK